MKKQYISNAEYAKAYASYKRKLQYYKSLGYSIDFSRFEKQKVKRPTKGSIRQLETLEKRLKEAIHDYRRETGYYTKRREEANKKRKATLKRKERNLKKRKKGRKVELGPKEKNKKKKGKIHYDVFGIKVPTLSDAVLVNIEAKIETAKNYMNSSNNTKNNKLVSKIIEAGYEADKEVSESINNILNKYMPDLSKEEVRKEIAKHMLEKDSFYAYDNYIEAFLYQYTSDGNGNLNHTTTGVKGLMAIIEAISGTKISIEDKKKIEELLNESVEGYAYTDNDTIDID